MQCPRASGTKFFRQKIENADRYTASLGAFRALLAPPNSAASSGSAASGPLDLIAAAMRTTASTTQRLVVLRRGVDLASNDSIRVDFAGPEPVPVDSAAYTVTGGPTSVITRVHTATTIGSLAGLQSGSPTGWYWSAPPALLTGSDMQSVLMSLTETNTTRGLLHYFQSPASLTSAFGPAVAVATVDTLANTISLPSQAEYPDVAGVGQRYRLDGRGVYADIEVWQTKGYAGGTPAVWPFAAPDVSISTARSWIAGNASSAAASTGGASPTLFFGGSPAAGTQLKWSVTNYGIMAISLPFPADR